MFPGNAGHPAGSGDFTRPGLPNANQPGNCLSLQCRGPFSGSFGQASPPEFPWMSYTRSPSGALLPFFWGRVPLVKLTAEKRGTLILTSLLEDLDKYSGYCLEIASGNAL